MQTDVIKGMAGSNSSDLSSWVKCAIAVAGTAASHFLVTKDAYFVIPGKLAY